MHYLCPWRKGGNKGQGGAVSLCWGQGRVLATGLCTIGVFGYREVQYMCVGRQVCALFVCLGAG